MTAVSFDFGQTLCELDYEFLRARLAERGIELDPLAARDTSAAAWALYGEKKAEGHALAWRSMIEVLLRGGGVSEARLSESSEWLWREQPAHNLWRRPIPGMIELVAELKTRRVPVGVISNSEGRLAELVEELGWTAHFDAIVDSGRLGIDKPHPRIFEHAARQLGVRPSELIQVGDSWEADVMGARGVQARAVWFDLTKSERPLPDGVLAAADVLETRSALRRFGVISE
jgi:putative hydrolase of the HAD superfamily